MAIWARHPQAQDPVRCDYSGFATAGTRMLCLLATLLLGGHAQAASADPAEGEPTQDSVAVSGDGEATESEAQASTATSDDTSGDAGASTPDSPPAAAAAAAPTSTSPDSPELKSDVPLRYVVKKGDTLWDIAGHYLKQPWKWPELWYSNPDIKNPHLIYPGEVLYLTYVDGKPRLSRDPPAGTGLVQGSGVERLSPRVREEDLPEAIPTIPGDAIRAFLHGPRVVGAKELEESPYLVEFIGEHIIGGAGIQAYAKGLDDQAPKNHSIVRKGVLYRDPETNEILGYEATYIGSASVLTPGETARVNIDTSVREVLIGDRLLPLDESELGAAAYYPHAPDNGIEGYIIAVTGGVSNIGQYQIVTLNKGKRDGMEIGHVFSIYQAGRKVRDPYGSANAKVTLPEEKAGLMLVFKTDERISYALVMQATRSIHLLDKFRNPDD